MIEAPLGRILRFFPLEAHLPDEHDQPPRASQPVMRLERIELREM